MVKEEDIFTATFFGHDMYFVTRQFFLNGSIPFHLGRIIFSFYVKIY